MTSTARVAPDAEVVGRPLSDDMEALLLRYKFADHEFPWAALKQAGWKFNNPAYTAPNGRKFKDGNAVVEYLDHYTVPDVYSNLQSLPPVSLPDKNNVEGAKDQQDLRRMILEYIVANPEGKDDDSNQNDGHYSTQPAAGATRPRRQRPQRQAAVNESSVTRTEKGSDLYLHKRSNRRKKMIAPVPLSDSDENVVLPSIADCQELVANHSLEHVEAIEAALQKDHFADWRFLLSTNHSLLFFGAGSKYHLLNSFCDKELEKEGYSLAISCWDSDVTLGAILDLMVQLFLDGKEVSLEDTPKLRLDEDDNVPFVGRSCTTHGDGNITSRAHPLVERSTSIAGEVAHKAAQDDKGGSVIFLVLHNLEGLFQREDAVVVEQALSALTSCSCVPNGTASIRLVASVDHLDSASWVTSLHWIWKEVHTYRPYSEEFALLGDISQSSKANQTAGQAASRRGESSEATAARAVQVLKAIAPRHAEVVQILARLQLDQPEEEEGWVDYRTFSSKCKDAYVIMKVSQLQPFLLELQDHRLIQSKIQDGSEYLKIPYDNEKLGEILAYRVKKK